MKRPWNIISPPVYSLVTYDEEGKVNMNICTYVSAVSMKPKIYSIAIDYTTKTYKNLEKSSKVVLQLLSASNLKVIRKLGKISGKLFDKDRYLNSYNLLQSWKDYNVLKDTCALIELENSKFIRTIKVTIVFDKFIIRPKIYLIFRFRRKKRKITKIN